MTDDVAQAGRQLAAIWWLDRHAEEAKRATADPALKQAWELARRNIDTRAVALERACLTTPATSLEGALAQVIVAINEMGDLKENEITQQRAEQLGGRIIATLFSIKAVIESEAGLNGEEFAASQYAPDYLDPHRKRESAA